MVKLSWLSLPPLFSLSKRRLLVDIGASRRILLVGWEGVVVRLISVDVGEEMAIVNGGVRGG